MKTFMYLALLLTIAWSESTAQAYDSTSTWKPSFYFGFPTQLIDVGGLNATLREAQLSELRSTMFGFSVGTAMRHRDQNSYSTGVLSFMTLMDDSYNDLRNSQINYWDLSIAGQYDITANPKWLVYPYLSIGTGIAFLSVSEVSNEASFRGGLDNLSAEDADIKRYNTGFMINGGLGAGVERQVILSGIRSFIGLSAGYEISSSEKWQLRNTSYYLEDSPAFQTNGWVVELRFRVEYDPASKRDAFGQSRGPFKFFR
ncbi:hypothetical protein [Tunicatimonas pelagia]|uniref:hypothetical protein n=1 Tax=Tunicatimonas pelagia TaxID=931531 RepID=UPI00266639FC|nr:hypothetical protein [Tunicatimonas pelagia]WKN42765.1 hypothetical protein P0M28_27385 [Tunicatimonas pelagia]